MCWILIASFLAAGCGGIAYDDDAGQDVDAELDSAEEDAADETIGPPDETIEASEDGSESTDETIGPEGETDEGESGTEPDAADDAGRLVCQDDCGFLWTHNGICEDGGSGSDGSSCQLGHDCADCGPRWEEG